MPMISIHALREESDALRTGFGVQHTYFYPRPPRGERLRHVVLKSFHRLISIHALREESDRRKEPEEEQDTNFYPRPPRGERR